MRRSSHEKRVQVQMLNIKMQVNVGISFPLQYKWVKLFQGYQINIE